MSTDDASLQPFQCSTCQRRFTRLENLKRHLQLHNTVSEVTLQCPKCPATFSRRDLRRRHMKRKHPGVSLEDGDSDSTWQVMPTGSQWAQQDRGTTESEASKSDSTRGQLVSSTCMSEQPHPNNTQAPMEDPLSWLNIGHESIHMPPEKRHSSAVSPQPFPGPTSARRQKQTTRSEIPEGQFTAREHALATESTGETELARQTWTPSTFDALLQQFEHRQSSLGTADVADCRTLTHGPAFVSPPLRRLSPPPKARPSQANPLFDPALIRRASGLFFTNTSRFFAFLHQPTFDPLDPRHPQTLVAGITCTGLLFSSDLLEKGQAHEWYAHGKALMEDDNAWTSDVATSAGALSSLQALVLLSNFAIMVSGGDETQVGLRMHSKCVELARKRGLAEPYLAPAQDSSNLEELWRAALRAESHKRTLFCIYLLDAIWYCLISRPRSLSHLEIKHELPLADDFWEITCAADWAHRTLTGGLRSSKLRYFDAVRATLAVPPDSNLCCQLDTQGTMLVMMFHYTSLRELSGWSTMSGRMSLERFEAIHSALTMLESSASFPSITSDPCAVACEATWHICMIEICLWSTPHTVGLVEDSLDGAIVAAAMLAKTNSNHISPDVIEALEPHLSWMLLYLARATPDDVAREPPWLPVYIFKACLVSWQALGVGRGLLDQTAAKIGVDTSGGDLGQMSMVAWMEGVFAQRTIWGVGKAVKRGLKELRG